MQRTKSIGRVNGFFMIIWFSFIIFAASSGAEQVKVRDILGDASKFSDKQVQIEGRVERWVELGNSEKTGLYVLKDNFGDEIQINTMEKMPPVGESVTVKGLVIFDSKKNEYYLQSLNNLNGIDSKKTDIKENSSRKSILGSLLTPDSGTVTKLLAISTAAVVVFLFIGVIAYRVRKSNKKVFDVPDFSFDDTETIKIDVNGQFMGSDKNDESTMILMPGHFEVTRGPNELVGRLYHLNSVITKIGRDESTVDKSNGWISFPSNCTTISRHQANLVFEDGALNLENMSRSIMTTLNGVPLTNGEPCKLRNKDIIAFGDIELTFTGLQ